MIGWKQYRTPPAAHTISGAAGGGAQAPGIVPAPTCWRPGAAQCAAPEPPARRRGPRRPEAGGASPWLRVVQPGASRRTALASGFGGRSAERREARKRPERCRTKIRLERSASELSGPNPAEAAGGELNQITCFVRRSAACPEPKKSARPTTVSRFFSATPGRRPGQNGLVNCGVAGLCIQHRPAEVPAIIQN